MAYDPNNPIVPTYDRLRRALEQADEHETIVAMRNWQEHAAGEFVTRNHSMGNVIETPGQEDDDELPIDLQALSPQNPLHEMASAYLSHLVPNEFAVDVEPKLGTEWLAAQIARIRLERACEDAAMADCVNRITLSALLGVGIGIVRIMDDAIPQPFGTERFGHGQPYPRSVDVRDFIVDPRAKHDLTMAQYTAEVIVLDREMAMAKVQGPGADILRDLPSVWESQVEGRESTDSDLYTLDLVYAIEVEFCYRGERYFGIMPHFKDSYAGWIVEPFALDSKANEPRHSLMRMAFVDGSLQPVSPAMVLMDAHLMARALSQRAVAEAWTARRKLVTDAANEDSASRLGKSGNGIVIANEPDKVREMVLGGQTEPIIQALAMATALTDRIGVSVPMLKGSKAPESTAYANSLIAGNGSTIMGAWAARKNACVDRMLTQMLWLDAKAPKAMLNVAVPLGDGTDVRINYDPSLPHAPDLATQNMIIRGRSTGKVMDPRLRQTGMRELLQVMLPAVMGVGQLGGDVAKTARALCNAWEWPELAEALNLSDGRQLADAVRGMIAQAGAGGMGQGGPQTTQAQMASDFAPLSPR